MSAGPKYEYHWADGVRVKRPIKCCAPEYIDFMMTWVQEQLDSETVFPSRMGVPFPKNFMQITKTILKRLFRVYAHIYHAHFEKVCQLEEERHLNTSFKHFTFFVHEFDLIDKKELVPLAELIDLNLVSMPWSRRSTLPPPNRFGTPCPATANLLSVFPSRYPPLITPPTY
jgi:MOB kinase activator 1